MSKSDFPQTIRFWLEIETRNNELNLSDLMDNPTSESDLCVEIIDRVFEQSDRKYIKRSKLAKIGIIRMQITNK